VNHHTEANKFVNNDAVSIDKEVRLVYAIERMAPEPEGISSRKTNAFSKGGPYELP